MGAVTVRRPGSPPGTVAPEHPAPAIERVAGIEADYRMVGSR